MYSRNFALMLFFILLLSCFIIADCEPVSSDSPRLIRVPQDFGTIQGAVDAADSGDTVLVARGIYRESIVIETEDLTLLGEDSEATIIHGDYGVALVSMLADGLTLTNFTLQFGHDGFVLNRCHNSTIAGNRMIDIYYHGLALILSDNNTIRGNVVTRRSVACWAGIRLDASNYNTIEDNNVTEINETFGVGLITSHNNTIRGNNIAHNSEGLYLASSMDNTAEDNNISGNRWGGIRLESSQRNLIRDNQIDRNWAAIRLADSEANVIYYNNFVNNTVQTDLFEASQNTWDNGYPSGGNYWSDHMDQDSLSGPNGTAIGSDGIADEPYTVDSNNIDHHPLAGPIHKFSIGRWNNTDYHASSVSNSTVSNLSLQPKNRQITLDINTSNSTVAFYRTSIPKKIIYSPNAEWLLLVEDQPTNFTSKEDDEFTYLYFTTADPATTAKIIGTETVLLPPIREIAVDGQHLTTPYLYRGEKYNLTTIIQNKGEAAETFNATIYLNSTPIHTITISEILPGENLTYTYTLDFNELLLYVSYEIRAEAGPVPDEASTENNSFIFGAVTTRIRGDVNGDRTVNIVDISIVAVAFKSKPGSVNWNQNADLNQDSAVDILDISLVATEYGKTCT